MTDNELITSVIIWGREKKLNDAKAQLNKVIEEVGEIAHEITRNRDGLELEDAIGDSFVTLIILADICGLDPMACLAEAYFQIKNRNGKTSNGTFVKSEDLNG